MTGLLVDEPHHLFVVACANGDAFGSDLLELRDFDGAEAYLRGSGVFLQAFRAARAGNRHDVRFGEQPRERELCGRAAFLLRDPLRPPARGTCSP